MNIKKLFFITIVLLFILSTGAALASTFNKGDLVIVIYNEQAKEVAVSLGSIADIDFSQQNKPLLDPGIIKLEDFQVDGWEQLRGAFWGGLLDGQNVIYNVYFATTKETAPPLSQPSYISFLSTANALYNYYTNSSDPDEEVYFIGNSVTPKKESYDETMNSNSSAPGYFGGLNSEDRKFGESELTALNDVGYVDMYLYSFLNFSLYKGSDDSTEYTAVLRINADGSIILNPPVAVNNPPTIGGSPTTSVNEDEFYSFTPTTADDEGDELTFSIANKPDWASFNNSTGALTGRPTNDDVGIFSNIAISVSDGNNDDVSLDAFSIGVVAVNDPPEISGTPATSVNEDVTYSFTPTASDEENATLTFSINTAPSWASFNTGTGELSGTPTNGDGGITTSGIIISVSDGNSSDSLPAFNLTVNPVNDPPAINGTPATSINEDATYSFTPTASDEENATLTFSINTAPSWASFDTNTGKLSGTPTNGDGGITTSNIIISVSDGNSSNSLPSFNLTVVSVNDPPEISGTPATSVNEDERYSFIPTASDEESATLTFSINNKPSWAVFSESTGELSGTPGNNDVGTTTGILISVSDGVNSVSLSIFNLEVVNTNDTPTISGTPDTAVLQGEEYSFIPTANDVDAGDTLTFSIVNRPEWATFETSTGQLSGTPAADDVGTTNGIVISVTDGKSSPVSLPTFNIKVSSSNEPPEISGSPDTSVNEDSSYLFIPTASDNNGDELIFSIQNRPSWANFNASTGELSGTPVNNDVGTTTGIVISVSDSIAEPVSLPAFGITVNNTNDIPVISGTPLTEVEEDSSYSFTPSASDDDLGDTLTFNIVNQPGWATFNSTTGELSGTPSNSNVGTTSGIIISVTDGNCDPVSLPAFDLKVVNINDAPTIEGTPATSVNEDSEYSFIPIANDSDTGDIISFSISNKPEWALFNRSTGALTGTPDNDDVGTTTGIVISVTDGNSDPVSLPAFNLEVVNVNDSPIISTIGDRTIIQGDVFNDIDLNDYVVDEDNTDSEISWTYTADETNITFNINENNLLSVSVLSQDWIGSVSVSFTATDPDGASDSETVKFTVNPSPPTKPSVNFPSEGSEVTDNPPVLSINNSTSSLGTITYDFELASDVAFNDIIASDYDYPEGENTTSWSLSERFSDLELDENRIYYWRASAQDSNTDSGWMDVASFIMNEINEEPSTPIVSYPEPGSQVSDLTPILEITNSTDPDNDDLQYKFEIYNFEFSDNSSPGGSPIMIGEVTEESDGTTSYQVANSLTDNTSYWWRVRAEEKNSNLISTWAGPYKFIVNMTNNAPTRPGLISPETNGEVDTYNPELVVSNSTDEDVGDVISYIFQIDTVNTFNGIDFDEELVNEGSNGTTSWSPSGLEEGLKYYWRVKASDGSEESGWMTSSFTVNVINDPPQTPVPTYPEDEKTVRTSSIILKAESASDPDNDAVFYTFEVCESGGDCTLYEGLENSELKLTGLSNNGEYEWAVKAVDEHGAESGWSDNRAFKVITNYTPNPPKLNNPVSGGSVYINGPILLSVKNSTDDDGDELTYYFELYADSQLSDLIETGSVSEGSIITEYEVKSDLTADATYYWRAYASDGDNNSSYSSTFNFICSSEEAEYKIDVIESQVVYSSMLEALGDGEYIDVSVDDESSDLDGVTISIPAGAIDSDINITIGEATSTPALPSGVAVTGRIIDFGPEGTVFNSPVIIKVPYTQEDLTSMGTEDPLKLRLYTYSNSSTGWEILEPISVDTDASLLLFEVSHFSIYTFGIETDNTGTTGSSDDSSGGGGICFINTVTNGSGSMSSGPIGMMIWGLFLFAILTLIIIRKKEK